MQLTPTVRAVAGLIVAQAVLVFAFVYPGYKPTPHHVPVAVVAPAPVAAQAAAKAGSAFDVERYPSEAAARAAIDRRDVYGALVSDPTGPKLLVASAASFTVAQLLRHAFGPARVIDVKPLSANDPRGATINLAFLPLIGICFSAVLALGALRLSRRGLLAAVVAFGALGGVAVAALLHAGLDALPGSYPSLAALTALTILAVALPTAALHRLFGGAGTAAAAVLFLIFANPASGNGTAPELLPSTWRWLGQLLPPGAGGTALRNTSYFDGHALARPLLVLATFAVTGAALLLTADRLRRPAVSDVRGLRGAAA